MVDATDLKLLRALQENPDSGIAELGERIGLSHTPCWRRLKKLQNTGIINGRSVQLDADALGLQITVFCSIRLKRHDKQTMEAFEAAARAHPNIVQCYTMTGDQDYLLRVLASSVKAYERIIKDDLLSLPSVGQMNSSFGLSEIKNSHVLPI